MNCLFFLRMFELHVSVRWTYTCCMLCLASCCMMTCLRRSHASPARQVLLLISALCSNELSCSTSLRAATNREKKDLYVDRTQARRAFIRGRHQQPTVKEVVTHKSKLVAHVHTIPLEQLPTSVNFQAARVACSRFVLSRALCCWM
jgi:hypothetical protein